MRRSIAARAVHLCSVSRIPLVYIEVRRSLLSPSPGLCLLHLVVHSQIGNPLRLVLYDLPGVAGTTRLQDFPEVGTEGRIVHVPVVREQVLLQEVLGLLDLSCEVR